ncbi:hypothetical protein GCM10007875_17390 [Limnobacter litoralis]|uniref:Uncharacterized protein n=2 Tax=Limnobacter litoralis TaxID=481366 RepID=A0ABQ5YPY8_9BURK|nr:hypothetical protein GCM10007875_17390 [Limnobacter litoralis]
MAGSIMANTFDTPFDLTEEDRALMRAEQSFADPSSLNMQILQSTVTGQPLLERTWDSAPSGALLRSITGSHSDAGSLYSGFQNNDLQSTLNLASAASNAGLLASAMALTSQVASASPAAFGQDKVSDGTNLADLGGKAFAVPGGDHPLPFDHQAGNATHVYSTSAASTAGSPEFMHLLAGLDTANNLAPAQAVPSLEHVNALIQSLTSQIDSLHAVFNPVMPGLGSEVQSMVPEVAHLAPADLTSSIAHDSGLLQGTLDTLHLDTGAVSSGLDNLTSGLNSVTDLVHSLPGLDGVTSAVHSVISPVTDTVTSVISPVVNTVTTVTDPVLNTVTGILDPVTHTVLDPVLHTVTGVVDPVTNIVTGATQPVLNTISTVTEPISQVTSPILHTITDPITAITAPVTGGTTGGTGDLLGGTLNQVGGILGTLSAPTTSGSDSTLSLNTLSSSISSSATGGDSAVNHLLGALDPNKHA